MKGSSKKNESKPGQMRFYSPDIAHRESFGEWIVFFDHVVAEARDPGSAADGGYHRTIWPDLDFFHQTAGEDCTQDTFVAKVLVETEFSLGVERRHSGTGS